MSLQSKRFLHPDAIRRVGRLEIRARLVVDGLLSGIHRSPYFGRSIEFLQHRQYAPGDDYRHIDWKAWAKKDRLYVKQFEEDSNLRCNILLDCSRSMEYGSGPLGKFDYAATMAVSLAYLLLRQHDSVRCTTFDEEVRYQTPFRSTTGHLATICDALENSPPRDKTATAGVLETVANEDSRRGMVVLVSDLLDDTDAVLRGLRLLRQRGHDVLVLHVMDDDELDFPFDGPVRFEGLEELGHLNCHPRALRDGYLQSLEAFLAKVRRGCARQAVDYTLVRTSQPLDAALASLLSKRLSGKHKR